MVSSRRPAAPRRLIWDGPAFARRSRVDVVVIDCACAPQALHDFAIKAFQLRHVEMDGDFKLYRTPQDLPAEAGSHVDRAEAEATWTGAEAGSTRTG